MEALKVVSFLNRRADFTLPAFSEYWRTIHKAHALKLVEAGFIKGYIQNHRVDAEVDGIAPMADGAPELWIDDLAALQRLVESREYLEGAGPDEANFMTPPAIACVARESVLLEQDSAQCVAGALKVMLVFRRERAVSSDAFARLWLEGDGPLLMPASRPLRLTRQAVVEGDGASSFEGVECSWWPDLEEFRRVWARRDLRAAQGLVETDSLRGLLVREEVVLAPAQHLRMLALNPVQPGKPLVSASAINIANLRKKE